MQISDEKKNEYFNHFVARGYTTPRGFPTGITGSRLRKIKAALWDDHDFWWDIVLRHGGDTQTPEQMRTADRAQYDHCLGNFWGGVVQTGVERGWIKRAGRNK